MASRNRPVSSVLLLSVAMAGALPMASAALEPMDNDALSAVAGQDGIAITIDAPSGVSASSITWRNDVGDATNQGGLVIQNALLESATPDPVTIDLDVAADGGTPFLSIEATWDELGLELGGLRLEAADGATLSTASAGQVGFFSTGGLSLVNAGLFNSSVNAKTFDLRFSEASSPGDFILRQGGPGSPEFSFGDANLRLQMLGCDTNVCLVGIDQTEGIFLQADSLNLDLNFDLLFKNSPADFDRTGRQEMIKLGWTGELQDFRLSTGVGAIAGSSGLQIDTDTNFGPDFSFILGQAGTVTRAIFKDFVSLNPSDPAEPTAYSLPLTLDVVPAGTNPGSLCFGDTPACATGEGLAFAVDRQALAALIRNGRLRAYNTTVEVADPTVAGDPTLIDDPADLDAFNWSLGYTFGRLDANIAVYPGFDNDDDGDPLDLVEGMTADITLVANSPGNWAALQSGSPTAGANWRTNTHFFIADTNTAIDVNNADSDLNAATGAGDVFAFGLLNADFVWEADDLAIRIAGDSDTAFAGLAAAADIPVGGIGFKGGLWLQSSSGVRYQFRGQLGGGDLNALVDFAQITIADIRLDTDRFVFALSPGNTSPASVGFEGLLDFNSNTYISLAEPSRPDVEMRFQDVSGRVLWRDGFVQVSASADNPDNRPALTIANNLFVGASAAGGNPLRGTVALGTESLGEMVLPTGQFFSEIKLKPQL